MSESSGPSLEDRKALEIMQVTTRKEEGRYSIAIQFRDNKKVPKNKALAVSRFKGLSKKLEKNPTLNKTYDESMTNFIQKGYAQKVTEEARKGREYYY